MGKLGIKKLINNNFKKVNKFFLEKNIKKMIEKNYTKLISLTEPTIDSNLQFIPKSKISNIQRVKSNLKKTKPDY